MMRTICAVSYGSSSVTLRTDASTSAKRENSAICMRMRRSRKDATTLEGWRKIEGRIEELNWSHRTGFDKLSHRAHSRGVSDFDRLSHPVSENVPVAELVEATRNQSQNTCG